MIPRYVYKVAEELAKNKFEAFLVGGSLRDILLNREPKDFDIATNATPDQITKIFPKSIPTGAKFGTIIVIIEDENAVSQEVEITTYRSEKDYVGGRWPSHVEFSTNIIDDLKRRDFTINAIALNLNETQNFNNNQTTFFDKKNTADLEFSDSQILKLTNSLLDPFDGQKDLKNKIIRAVGNPIERFREDGLRSLRACRLASILGFDIEQETLNAIKETIEVPALVSKERVQVEIRRLIEESPKPSIGIELMRKTGLLELFIPELLEGYKLEHNKHHIHDVYQHALDTVDVAPREIRIAALFHDIGKPRSKDGEHFYGHDIVGADMTKEILERLKFSKKFIEDTKNLVRWHMFYLPMEEIKNSSDTKTKESYSENDREKRNAEFKNGWSDAAIRRLIRRVGGHDNVDNLIKLRIADAVANPKSGFDPVDIQKLSERVSKIREQDSLLSVRDLQISGHDLKELGVPEGPKMKEILEYLLEKVTEDIELNEKKDLVEMVKEYMKNGSQILKTNSSQ